MSDAKRDEAVAIILEQLRHPKLRTELPGVAACNGYLNLRGVADPAVLAKAIEAYRDSFVPDETLAKAEEAYRAFLKAAAEQQALCLRLSAVQHEQLVRRLVEEFKSSVNFDIYTKFPY
jgi:hypothetical protein